MGKIHSWIEIFLSDPKAWELAQNPNKALLRVYLENRYKATNYIGLKDAMICLKSNPAYFAKHKSKGNERKTD